MKKWTLYLRKDIFDQVADGRKGVAGKALDPDKPEKDYSKIKIDSSFGRSSSFAIGSNRTTCSYRCPL